MPKKDRFHCNSIALTAKTNDTAATHTAIWLSAPEGQKYIAAFWLDPAFHVGNPRAFSRTRAVASTFLKTCPKYVAQIGFKIPL